MPKTVRISVLLVAIVLVVAAGCSAGSGANNGDGTNEPSSRSTVIRVQGQTSLSECPNGGVIIDYGIDENDNGQLDQAEVNGSSIVCHGTDGSTCTVSRQIGAMVVECMDGSTASIPDAEQYMIVVQPEAAGTNCEFGGVVVRVGIDSDSDGTLTLAETLSTSFVCNGAGADGPRCGNGIVEAPEACDLGDGINDDQGACTAACAVSRCGDGLVGGPGEECDDGNESTTDACPDGPTGSCQTAHCGDGYLFAPVESCDDGNQNNLDSCNNACLVPGTEMWRFTHNGADANDALYGVAVDPSDGSIYVVGSEQAASQDIFVAKLDPLANVLWSRSQDGPGAAVDTAMDVALDRAGNVYVVGYEAQTVGGQDIWVRKYSPDGTTLWTTRHAGIGGSTDQGRGIAVDDTNHVYVVGYERTGVDASTDDAWIWKLDSAGNEVWARTNDSGSWDRAQGVAVDSQLNVVVVGSENPGTNRAWIRKYDTDGNTLWTRTRPNISGAWHVAVDSADNIVVVGSDTAGLWARKYTKDGGTIWTENGGPTVVAGWGVAVDPSDNIVIAGRTATDAWTRKLTPSGSEIWTAATPTHGAGVATNTSGDIYVVGSVDSGPPEGWNGLLIKYAP